MPVPLERENKVNASKSMHAALYDRWTAIEEADEQESFLLCVCVCVCFIYIISVV